MSARRLAALIHARELSARDVMTAHLERIAARNPELNAIVAKLDDEACLALADEADRLAASGAALPPLHGLPIAFKDLEAVRGFPLTQGSRIFKDNFPEHDSVFAERVRLAGAIPIGKTNVPEFGLGSHTYNKVYGTTVNPYDATKSSGGSSGGAAAALAVGMLPIADGSDFGGSLRNPASFNNVVGFRSTVGLVPTAPNPFPFLGFTVKGPMARNVADVAWLLSVMAGADARDPGCAPSDPTVFAGDLTRSFRDVRIAWCPDLGGLPLDPRVRTVIEGHRRTFEALGARVETVWPDLRSADSVFLTIRAWRNAAVLGPLMERHRELMKPEAIEEVERGRAITARGLSRAMLEHGELLDQLRRFQEDYEFFVCTTSQVPPFDKSIDWPDRVDGVPMEGYLGWMKSAYWVSVTFRPAISVPAGFTPHGLPVGIQIVGRHRDDLGVLQLAHAFEQVLGAAGTGGVS